MPLSLPASSKIAKPPSADFNAVRIDAAMARIVGRAMEQAGMRRSQESQRVGDYQLFRASAGLGGRVERL